jgi:hypothetical protein
MPMKNLVPSDVTLPFIKSSKVIDIAQEADVKPSENADAFEKPIFYNFLFTYSSTTNNC